MIERSVMEIVWMGMSLLCVGAITLLIRYKPKP